MIIANIELKLCKLHIKFNCGVYLSTFW